MRRILLGAAVVTVWLGTFLVTLAATDPTPVECNDNPTSVAAICAMPGPSLLPALPLATLAAVLVALALVPRLRRAR